MRRANYEIVEDAPAHLILRDIGPWDICLTITNAAEDVVEEVASMLKGRRLYYFDSTGRLDELLVKDGRFAGFKPGPAFWV